MSARSSPPRGIPEVERRRFAQVIDRYYAYIDAELGAALDAVRSGDLVVVISGFGMERLSPAKQLLARGQYQQAYDAADAIRGATGLNAYMVESVKNQAINLSMGKIKHR